MVIKSLHLMKMMKMTVTKRDKNLKYDGLIVLAEVVCKHVGIHECLPAKTQDVDGFTQELHLNP